MNDDYAIGYKPLFVFNQDAYTDTPHSDALAGVSAILSAMADAEARGGGNAHCTVCAFDLVGGIVDALRESLAPVEASRVFDK